MSGEYKVLGLTDIINKIVATMVKKIGGGTYNAASVAITCRLCAPMHISITL